MQRLQHRTSRRSLGRPGALHPHFNHDAVQQEANGSLYEVHKSLLLAEQVSAMAIRDHSLVIVQHSSHLTSTLLQPSSSLQGNSLLIMYIDSFALLTPMSHARLCKSISITLNICLCKPSIPTTLKTA